MRGASRQQGLGGSGEASRLQGRSVGPQETGGAGKVWKGVAGVQKGLVGQGGFQGSQGALGEMGGLSPQPP